MLRKITVALLAAGATLAVGELAARIWLKHFASEEAFSRYASMAQQVEKAARTGQSPFKYLPHQYLGYIPAPNYVRGKNRHNDLGFRGDPIPIPKPPGEFRIVCLGGSTTYTTFVDDPALSYPGLLEAELRTRGHATVRVINAGAEGYTSWESLMSLEFRVLDLEPDLIIMYDAVNDLLTRIVWPPWAYRGDNSGSLQHSGNFYRRPSLLERSTLLTILRVRFGAPSPSDLAGTHVQFASTAFAWPFIVQTMAGTYPQGIFETIGAEEMLRKNQPVFFERNLRNMVAVAREWHIQPVLATFAFSDEVRLAPFDSPTLAGGMEEMNRVIARLAQELDVPLFDFAAVFPDDVRLYGDPIHVSEEGARLQAKMFADFLESRELLPASQ
jgi:lysophospholipase L1-like esterase